MPRKGGVYRIEGVDGTTYHVLAVGPIPDDPSGLWHGRSVAIEVEIESAVIFDPDSLVEIGESDVIEAEVMS